MTLLFLHTNACVVNNEGLWHFCRKLWTSAILNDASLNLIVILFMVTLSNYIFVCSVYRCFDVFVGMHEVPAIINEYRFRKWQIFLFFNGFLFQLGSTYKILPYLKIRIKFFLIFITSFKQSCHFESQRLTIVGLVIVFWHSFLNNISWK